jgi:hypothetical protein
MKSVLFCGQRRTGFESDRTVGLLSEHNRRWAFFNRTTLDTIAAMSCYRDKVFTAMVDPPLRRVTVMLENQCETGEVDIVQ